MAIPLKEQRLVLQKSGNRCAFVDCRKLLTADASTSDRPAVLGEIAHIVAERPLGPRGASPMGTIERNRYENLILLCNQHHQVVDSQPETYTAERLRAMKEEHEAWVERILSRPPHGETTAPPTRTETVYSTLLAVERMPQYIYGVPCGSPKERDVDDRLLPPRSGEMAPFVLRGGMLFAFQDLNRPGNPFADFVPGRSAERFALEEWIDEPDQMNWIMDLLGRALNKLTGRLGLRLDREHHRYYFHSDHPEEDMEIEYRPLNRRRASRKVVWRRRSKVTGERRGPWYHRAVALRFLRVGRGQWCLSMRPELRVTVDGFEPLSAGKIGSRVTKEKARRFNYDLLGEVNFWRDYLSGGSPRIVMPFGPQQGIVIPTTLISGTVDWPGYPKDFVMPFTNVEYVDDLFSWAELTQLEMEDDGAWDDEHEATES